MCVIACNLSNTVCATLRAPMYWVQYAIMSALNDTHNACINCHKNHARTHELHVHVYLPEWKSTCNFARFRLNACFYARVLRMQCVIARILRTINLCVRIIIKCVTLIGARTRKKHCLMKLRVSFHTGMHLFPLGQLCCKLRKQSSLLLSECA